MVQLNDLYSAGHLTCDAAMGESHANRQASAELERSLYLAEDYQVLLGAPHISSTTWHAQNHLHICK